MTDQPRKEFCSHRFLDGSRVEIAKRLRDAGLGTWLDRWSEGELDDGVVANLNEALDDCDIGLLFLSKDFPEEGSNEGRWFRAEIDYFTKAAVQRSKHVAGLRLDPELEIPPLLSSRPTFDVDQLDGVIALLTGQQTAPEPGDRGPIRVDQLTLELSRTDETLQIAASTANLDLGTFPVDWSEQLDGLLDGLIEEFQAHAPARSRYAEAERIRAAEQDVEALGERLGAALFPPAVTDWLTKTLDEGRGKGRRLKLTFASSEALLLELPFEATHLPDRRAVSLEPAVRLIRRLLLGGARPMLECKARQPAHL